MAQSSLQQVQKGQSATVNQCPLPSNAALERVLPLPSPVQASKTCLLRVRGGDCSLTARQMKLEFGSWDLTGDLWDLNGEWLGVTWSAYAYALRSDSLLKTHFSNHPMLSGCYGVAESPTLYLHYKVGDSAKVIQ
ncbi:hypothetical protein DVH24_020529 [Malus domestica]|uniref:Uncharacterized protein n=1 Tax=Malus domestica TaxID=3750 RepID=A0A498J8N8_MALDO|nr:hypothetical protein DVH24_020529 [Malus domestica]